MGGLPKLARVPHPDGPILGPRGVGYSFLIMDQNNFTSQCASMNVCTGTYKTHEYLGGLPKLALGRLGMSNIARPNKFERATRSDHREESINIVFLLQLIIQCIEFIDILKLFKKPFRHIVCFHICVIVNSI